MQLAAEQIEIGLRLRRIQCREVQGNLHDFFEVVAADVNGLPWKFGVPGGDSMPDDSFIGTENKCGLGNGEKQAHGFESIDDMLRQTRIKIIYHDEQELHLHVAHEL